MKKKAKQRKQKKSKLINNNSTARLLIWISIFSITACIIVREYYYANTIGNIEEHQRAYKKTKEIIHQKRLSFEQEWVSSPHKHNYLQKSAKACLYQYLTDSIFPYWYGTPWDFNGTSQKPLQGQIACGYFVTTTLSHLEFYLPRVKMAQQAASKIIRSLCSDIKTFNKINLLKKHIDKHKQGIFIVGLDTHVGFLWQSPEGLYFVHSSYSGNKQVSKEKWNISTVLNKSKLFVVGNLLDNSRIIKTWIMGENIKISK